MVRNPFAGRRVCFRPYACERAKKIPPERCGCGSRVISQQGKTVNSPFPKENPVFPKDLAKALRRSALPLPPLLYKRAMSPKNSHKDRRHFYPKPGKKPAENLGRP